MYSLSEFTTGGDAARLRYSTAEISSDQQASLL
jgi:hypothetical protein